MSTIINRKFNGINELMEILTDKEREVISLKFGLNRGGAKTYEQIGEVFNISRSRVHQIVNKAIGKMDTKLVEMRDELDR